MDTRVDALNLIEAACWNELERAAHEREHEWRLMALATADGSAPDLRTVVLRECDRTVRQLTFYTDARSPKVAQIVRMPQGTLLVWSRRLGWQLRMRCHLVIETDGQAVSARWARLKMTPSAQDYLSPLPPGTPIEHPGLERGTREHFAVVHARIATIDWLELHDGGHRRARFSAAGPSWLHP